MKLTYLGHSGFLLDTGAHVLVFDYAPGANYRSLAPDTQLFADREVVVFASHAHADHWNKQVLEWRERYPNIRYVLSADIRTHADCLRVRAHESHTLDETLRVQTLRSTDQGVAFLVEVDGFTVYHAGDLNWWHWEGEPNWDNAGHERRFKAELAQLAGARLELALLPCDPRQGEAALWGADYFARTLRPRRIVPMHFWDDESIFARISADELAAPWRERVLQMAVGESAELSKATD